LINPIFAISIVKIVLTPPPASEILAQKLVFSEAGHALMPSIALFSFFPQALRHSKTSAFRLKVQRDMASSDSHSFRQLMGCFATGVTVVTLADPQLGKAGITINSLTSVSLDPPLILFCLDKKARLYPAFRRAKLFAVNILSEEQEAISRHFANYRLYPEAGNIWDKPKKGCPILRGTLGWMVCRKKATYQGGDHVIYLAEAVDLYRRAGSRNPLLYVHSRYGRVAK